MLFYFRAIQKNFINILQQEFVIVSICFFENKRKWDSFCVCYYGALRTLFPTIGWVWAGFFPPQGVL